MISKRDYLCELIREAAKERATEVVTYLALQLAKDCSATPKDDPPDDSTAAQSVLGVPQMATPPVVLRFVREYLRSCCSPGSLINFSDIAFNVESLVVGSGTFCLDGTMNESERRPRWRNHVSQAIDVLRREGVLVKSDKNRVYQVIGRP